MRTLTELRREAVPLERFLLAEEEFIKITASDPYFTPKDAGEEPVAKKAATDKLWHSDHIDAFRQQGLRWPPAVDPPKRFQAHLPRRLREIIFFHQHGLEEGNEDITDINMNINWGYAANGKTCCITSGSTLFLLRLGREMHGSEALALQGLAHEAQKPLELRLAAAEDGCLCLGRSIGVPSTL